MATTEFTSSSYLADYLSPDPSDHPLPIDQSSQDPFSRPMSPVQSAASTPPLANHNSSLRTMASFASPVSMSSAPYGMPMPPSSFPRRAEHSYAQNYMPHPYTMGAPPRGPQLPSASLLQPQPPSTYVPDVPSSAPDAPPSGTGGSRKRPKYTRSKKGCLTCRSKKIKCDERKPLCTRCEHGHRECTWPETVLPRRPKGAVRGVGNEDDDEEEEHPGDDRRASIPGSAVSSHFPSSTTSSHFPGIGNNSPFDTAPPRRDAFDSDGYTNGSQFPLPVLPANARQFYPRAPGSAPSGEFYPVTTVNGQPIDEYEFPPRQTFGAGSSSGGLPRGTYSNTNGNGSLYANGPPGSVASYNADLRRASWDSNAPTDGRRPSWDATSLAVSSASSPTTSSLGLGLGGLGRAGGSGATTSAGSSAGGAGGSASGVGPGLPGGSLMLFQSPDPLSPFFRSVQERNLVGNISSFTPSSTPPFTSSPFSSASSSFLSRPPSEYGAAHGAAATAYGLSSANGYMSSSPVLSSASSTEFGVTPEGLPYRKNSYPHLYPPPRALTLDPPAPVISPAMNISSSPTSLSAMAMADGGSKSNSDAVDWLAPPAPAMDVYRPSSSAWTAEGDEYVSWDAYS